MLKFNFAKKGASSAPNSGGSDDELEHMEKHHLSAGDCEPEPRKKKGFSLSAERTPSNTSSPKTKKKWFQKRQTVETAPVQDLEFATNFTDTDTYSTASSSENLVMRQSKKFPAEVEGVNSSTEEFDALKRSDRRDAELMRSGTTTTSPRLDADFSPSVQTKHNSNKKEGREESQNLHDSYTKSFDTFLEESKVKVEKSLLAIITDQHQCAHFQSFLDSRFMGEGLRALVEIVKFEQNPSLEMGRAIYDRFVVDSDSGDTVTLSKIIIDKIEASLEANENPVFYEMKLDILMSLSLVLAEFLEKFHIPSVDECFNVEKYREEVIKFARSCFMEESVLFLMMNDEFVKTKDIEVRKKIGHVIMARFFTPGGEHEINVSSKVIEGMKKKVEEGDYGPDCFELAKKDQMKLYVFDIYPRFIQKLSNEMNK